MSQLQILEKDVEIPASLLGEVDAQVRTAKAYPRNISQCMRDAEMMATFSEDVAASCYFSVPRSGKTIQGASVRLAEILASSWGNMYAATRIIDNDGFYITAEAYCWDLEKNVRIGTQVKKSIRKSNGAPYTPDMQAVAENAASSIALRNAIFKVVPRAYVDSLFEKCQQKALGTGDGEEKFILRRAEVFQKLEAMGVVRSDIFRFFKKQSIEEFDRTDVKNLIGVGTAMKEGQLKVEEAFRIEPSKTDALVEQMERKGS